MSATVETLTHAEAAGGRDGTRAGRHVAYFYFIRTLTVYAFMAVGVWMVFEFGHFGAWHALVVLIGLVYPHLSYFLQARLELGRRVEHATLVVDTFCAGSTIYMLGFAELPSVALVLITLINPVAFTGFAMIGWATLSFVLAIALPWWTLGPNFAPSGIGWVNLGAVVYLFVYYLLFAHAVFLRTVALQRSRRELRQQRITIEIGKKRSDALLLSILPRKAASEYEARGAVAPRRIENAALLLVRVSGLGEGPDPARAFDETTEVMRALDAICARHGLDGLKTFGNTCLAAALDAPGPEAGAAALAAAREIIADLREQNQARAARGEAPLACSAVLHAGPVAAGVLETRKVTYELLGPAVAEVAAASRNVPEGRLAATQAACELAGVRGEPAPQGNGPALFLLEA